MLDSQLERFNTNLHIAVVNLQTDINKKFESLQAKLDGITSTLLLNHFLETMKKIFKENIDDVSFLHLIT